MAASRAPQLDGKHPVGMAPVPGRRPTPHRRARRSAAGSVRRPARGSVARYPGTELKRRRSRLFWGRHFPFTGGNCDAHHHSQPAPTGKPGRKLHHRRLIRSNGNRFGDYDIGSASLLVATWKGTYRGLGVSKLVLDSNCRRIRRLAHVRTWWPWRAWRCRQPSGPGRGEPRVIHGARR